MSDDARAELSKLRDGIDVIDEKILKLLQERIKLAKHVGKIKQNFGLAYHVPERERAIIQRLRALNQNTDLSNDALGSVFCEVMSACLKLESPIQVSYLGPGSTFSYLALRKTFGNSAVSMPERTIDDVFDAVEMGRVDYAVIPLENSFDGSVSHSTQRMINTNTVIHGEVFLAVHHSLASIAVTLADVKKIYSHPQALAQCRNWIKAHLPFAEIVETLSTARACVDVKNDPHSAAISNTAAALESGLGILVQNIHDFEENETRFLVLSREKKLESQISDKTSVVFSIPNVHGKLAKILDIFAKCNVNLTKIETVPNRTQIWKAYFWVDMQGNMTLPNLSAALAEAENHCEVFKVFGSYPKIG